MLYILENETNNGNYGSKGIFFFNEGQSEAYLKRTNK